ncbi:DUF2326 domain-containing protein [Vibrio cyclitrophicus]|uniref:DUF2326 domain-containing protein n=1 Tax=Vibrio cyclitrophicus TaxID=47951 RepID=UPI000C866F77|nr:DUF2326 domain-containing protein [Vibrio cyclitrophicus]PMF13743.1 hypothetical protein BCV20_11990 [Vibrio cyclitrophicus]
MKLNRLTITENGSQCRIVKFEDGLNLITNDKDIGRTGNSVGKSTLSRVIDFMLLGSIEPIYFDDEYARPNVQIESFFKESDVQCELSFTDHWGVYHVLVRNFAIDKDEFFSVDGNVLDRDEYEKLLLNLFFGIETSRPSLRLLAPKFIRNDSHKMLNTSHFLDARSKNNDYSELFLFLFGFNDTSLLTQRRTASNAVSRIRKRRAALNSILKDQKIKSSLKTKKREVESLESNILSIDFSPEHDNPIELLHQIQTQEDLLNNAVFGATLKIDNIKETVKQLDQRGGNYLVSELKAIYEFAGVSIEKVSRSFEETLAFHDNLVNKKRNYVESELPQLNRSLEDLKNQLKVQQNRKHGVFAAMRTRENIDKITTNIKELGALKNELGKLEGMVEQQEAAQSGLTQAIEYLNAILELISKQIDKVNDFEASFSKHFGEITKVTHDEEYRFTLNFNETEGTCEPLIENHSANPEGGKKKAEVIAFDFAYIKACYELGLNRPRFVLHDIIEDIDQKQIEDIFRLAQALPGQQIVSVLSDKFSEETYRKYRNASVLLLSEDNKFFNI